MASIVARLLALTVVHLLVGRSRVYKSAFKMLPSLLLPDGKWTRDRVSVLKLLSSTHHLLAGIHTVGVALPAMKIVILMMAATIIAQSCGLIKALAKATLQLGL